MPCSVVKPIPKLIESVGDEVLGSSKIEPRIDCARIQVSTGTNNRGREEEEEEEEEEARADLHSWMILSKPVQEKKQGQLVKF